MSNICKTVTLRTRKIKKGTQLSFYLGAHDGESRGAALPTL